MTVKIRGGGEGCRHCRPMLGSFNIELCKPDPFVTIPLYLSYRDLVKTTVLEKNWQQERFLVNDKYLIVQQAELVRQRENDLLFVRVLVREPLTRNDLNQIRKKIQSNFADTLNIRVQVFYIP